MLFFLLVVSGLSCQNKCTRRRQALSRSASDVHNTPHLITLLDTNFWRQTKKSINDRALQTPFLWKRVKGVHNDTTRCLFQATRDSSRFGGNVL